MPSVSIPAAIATGLTGLGVGAETAGVLAPVLFGAGTGALTSAVTGGKPLKGALIGGALGGIGPAASALGVTGPLSQGIPGVLNSVMGGGPSAASGGAGMSPADWAVSPEAEVTGAMQPGTGGALSGLAKFGSLALNNAQPIIGALSAFGRSPNAGYGSMPGPSTNAATLGPYWNQPANNTGYINRTPTNPLAGQPASSWYTYGQRPEQNFFNNNAITFPGGDGNNGALSGAAQAQQSGLPRNVMGPLGMARGGSVDAAGGGHIEGDGDGTSDSIPARLSAGEYVLTAADVSRIGAGSSSAGAKKLDQMRAKIASDAGATKFQGKVRAPLQYLRKAS
jgi:hypothetical protein